jgi:hypothetical protein
MWKFAQKAEQAGMKAMSPSEMSECWTDAEIANLPSFDS